MKKLLLAALCIISAHIASAQLTDAGFENWQTDTLGKNHLVSWKHYAGPTTAPNDYYFGTWRTDTVKAGSYALKLSRWYNNTCDWVQQVAAINSRPAALKGYYTYTDNELVGGDLDSALVEIVLTKWNLATAQQDTVGFGSAYLGRAAEYTLFNCPVTYYTAAMPDSVTANIRPMPWSSPSMNMTGWGSYLSIDALSLETATAIADVNTVEVDIFPNPATIYLNLQLKVADAYNIEVLDITGRVQINKNINAAIHMLDISKLPSGNYALRISKQDKRIATSVFVKK